LKRAAEETAEKFMTNDGASGLTALSKDILFRFNLYALS
jgi:hypothetical protein